MIRLALFVFLAVNVGEAPKTKRREACSGATYFYERHHPQPEWARRMVVVCVIGDHVFLKEKAK